MNRKKRGGAIETGEVTKTQWWEYRYWVGRKKTAKAIVDQRWPWPSKKLGNSGSLFNWIQRQKCQKKFRGVFRTKLSIYHEVFYENS